MGKSAAFDGYVLSLIFNNTNIANVGDSTGLRGSATAGVLYVSLHTAQPATSDQTSNEATYGAYARQSINRASGAGGFTVTGSSVSPASTIQFPACTSGNNTITYFGIGTAASGPGVLLYSGTVTPNIPVATPVVAILSTSSTVTES